MPSYKAAWLNTIPLEERFGRQLRQGQECAIGRKHPFADQRVDRRMPMDQASRSLDGSDHARRAHDGRESQEDKAL